MSKEPMSRVFWSISALLAVVCGAANIQPNQYTLQLLIDTDADAFSGSLVIDAKVLDPSATNFTLHNNGLNISTVSVTQEGGADVYQSMTSSADDQSTLITLAQGLTTDRNVQITITYQGRVSTNPTGLFSFWDSGKKFYMTNFYPIYARKVFPCIDEPGTAAPIALTLIVTKPNGNLVASTLQSQEPVLLPNGYTKYELLTTNPIAPYSLFFTMGEWNSDEYYPPAPKSKLWLPPSLQGQYNNIDPGLVVALRNPNITSFLARFVDHLNIFVAPVYNEETYSGLNTVVLRKDILIKNVQETTSEMERDHLLKITYALWKIFFGTAVRPADWGDNWLSTSIPMYLAYKILDEPQCAAVYGTSDENLVPGLYEKVFDTSSAADSPVTYLSMAPTKPKDILSFVQSSGVEKGVYALKTIESSINPATLTETLFDFLVQQNNNSVGTADFIEFIEASTKTSKNLLHVMVPIIALPGYPLVSLNRNGGTLDMLKADFVKVGNKPLKFAGEFSQLGGTSIWMLPVTATTSQNPNPANATVYFFNAHVNTLVVSGYFPGDGWALLDLDGKGIMRTSYDYLSWSLFATAANTTFSPATRAKLVADAFAAAESKVQPWTATLKYMEALDSETHLAPWKTALAGFKRMWSWIYYTGSSDNTNSTGQINLVEPFKKYVKTRLSNIYQKLGPIGNNDDRQDPLRREIVEAMCEYGDSNCISNLTAQYDKMLNQGVNPSNDLLSVVVCNGLRNAKISTWTTAFNKNIFSGSWFPQPLLNSHYNFLSCPDSDNNEYSEAINAFLSNVLMNANGKTFPPDQILPAVSQILDKPQHVDQVLRFFTENQPKFNLTTGMQAEMVLEIGKRLTSPTQTEKLSRFLEGHNVTSDISTAIAKSIAVGNLKAQYIVSIQSDVQVALMGETPTTAPPTGSTGSTGSTDSSTGTTGTDTPPTTMPPPSSTTPGTASANAVSIVVLLATSAFALAAQ